MTNRSELQNVHPTGGIHESPTPIRRPQFVRFVSPIGSKHRFRSTKSTVSQESGFKKLMLLVSARFHRATFWLADAHMDLVVPVELDVL